MNYNGLLLTFPKELRMFLSAFVLVLSVGYLTGLLFVSQTDSVTPHGIEENYMGNENDEEAPVMKFKKGSREMLTIIHTHVLSMSFIFFLLGILLFLAKLPKRVKSFLLVEPFVSIIITFGGIYLMWLGVSWMKYIVVLSGVLMTLVYTTSAIIVLYQLCFHKDRIK
ncbi:hypothetical protein MQE36_00570 [Zhouia spongiae]|uniref:Uncharacterized protein n=1 Tax=Zhouia spongiae TaxID=2202721 RepID=A0ABY3YMJ9_9FLAO|nr:hypothetical protein [Zhouia spongiae]UNY98863.1 hypothetical protein MQE36_00570 [Zhouia spongiae]